MTTVSSYITKLRALVVELPSETEENQIYQFLKGLKPEIQARTRTHKPATLKRAMDIADEADRANMIAYRGSSRSSGNIQRPQQQQSSRYINSQPQPMQIGAVRVARNTHQGWDETAARQTGKVSA